MRSAANNSAPVIRFPEFSSDWEEKLGTEITSKITKGSSPKWQGFSYQDVGVLFVTSENVRAGYLDISKPKYLQPSFHEKHQNGRLKRGDILINLVGASIGRCCIYDESQDASTNQAVALFRVKDSENLQFISLCYQTDRIQRVIGGTQSDSARPNLSLTDLRNLTFTIPTLPEQRKIADFLTAVDGRIQQLSQKRALLQDYKKGVMQQLFTQALRFKDDHGNEFPDWEEKTLGEVLTIGSGRDYKHLGKGDVPVYGSGGVMTFVDASLYDGESVCIGRKGTIDKPRFLEGAFWTVDTLFYTHSFIRVIPRFIYAVFQQINWQTYNEASGVPSLSKSTIESIPVSIPHPAEQTKIANFLTALDRKIESVAAQITHTQTFKRGLLQQMFV